MMKKIKNETCYGLIDGECHVLKRKHSSCGTPYCIFYKPTGTEDSIIRKGIQMIQMPDRILKKPRLAAKEVFKDD